MKQNLNILNKKGERKNQRTLTIRKNNKSGKIRVYSVTKQNES